MVSNLYIYIYINLFQRFELIKLYSIRTSLSQNVVYECCFTRFFFFAIKFFAIIVNISRFFLSIKRLTNCAKMRRNRKENNYNTNRICWLIGVIES